MVALPLPYKALPWQRPCGATDGAGGGADADGKSDASSWADRNGLTLQAATSSWETSAAGVARQLEASGLEVRRLLRAPYLCQGSSYVGGASLDVLDGVVLVCTRRSHRLRP